MAKLVNWNYFEKKLKEKQLLLFTPLEITRVLGVSAVAASFLVHRYTRKGFIARIKRGLYGFPGELPPEPYIANRLCEPSYVSLEFALAYHRVIPETVYEITSVTPKATRHFNTLGKAFTYRRIKKAGFTGYVSIRRAGVSYLIAEPEKAFIDAVYLRAFSGKGPLQRFDREKLNRAKALRYAALFGNDRTVNEARRLLS